MEISAGNRHPERITKPIQLLATWLACLIILVTILTSASNKKYESYEWLSVFYAISSVAIIPLFISLMFLMLTKYRLEMLEDRYYQRIARRKMYMYELNQNRFVPYKKLKG
ncbi:MAG: hypothetical protein V1850_00670 [Candidatus Bathyarchaeota archaeon]